MSADTIDHHTLSSLVEAGAVRGAQVIGKVGGWGVLIKYGTVERPLATTRSKKVRLFKKLETVVAYLKDLGISRFDVDAAQYDPATVHTSMRPDRVSEEKFNFDLDKLQTALASPTHKMPNEIEFEGFVEWMNQIAKSS
jgi:Asp-tRNA(Asn)/Glu-tRNA(Gln) amidotransferase C subunit